MSNTAKLKNKRLSDSNRRELLDYAVTLVRETEERTAMNSAYNAAADVIVEAVERNFPTNDMMVLQRYSMAAKDYCIYISNGGHGDYHQFTFLEDDKRVPLRPTHRCRNQAVLLEDDEAKVLHEYSTIKSAFDEAVRQRAMDFKSLIYNCATFNQLVEIWPGAEKMRAKIVGSSTALSIMSDEVLARIKTDPALKGNQA